MKILFVDDEDNIRELFQEYFHREFDVHLASNGEEALLAATTQSFDLIISDISLPKLNGIQFIQKLRSESIYTPFVVITGDSDIQIAIDVFRMGAVDFFLKPFRMESLRLRIKKFENTDNDTNLLFHTGEVSLVAGDYTLLFRPKIKNINKYVALILEPILNNPRAREEDLLSLKVVLYELIANAIEHGVAGVSYQEKQKLLEANEDYFLYVDRKCEQCQLSIEVHVSLDQNGIQIMIKDDGEGFDLASVPNPIENPGANLVSGRGIFLAKMNIDTIKYNQKGNEVRFYKHWTTPV
ncbi:ATP-binding protein [Leptospira idonii]|uniref:Response regulator n=1 Tax=Leptospira idonii TaxID=1193500 RepID=A0A4R9LTY2_9LEPT|nr:ATP-binding protein [Leptospira idonii]TGN17186.1 response regulator [Leptospira idonii]